MHGVGAEEGATEMDIADCPTGLLAGQSLPAVNTIGRQHNPWRIYIE